MIFAYILNNGIFNRVEVYPGESIPTKVVWIDLVTPTPEEERWVEKSININAPTLEEMGKIEVMSPFYKEAGAFYMTLTALNYSKEGYVESSAMTLILSPRCLVTLRYIESTVLSSFVLLANRKPQLCESPDIILIGILEMFLNEIGEVLEKIGNEIDTSLNVVFDEMIPKTASCKRVSGHNYYRYVIAKTGRTGNVISKNRESLVSVSRLLTYLLQIDQQEGFVCITKKEQRPRVRHINREIYSLSEYANFLSQRNSFMLDATLGMISVEQNSIIKIFTIASAAFMPPTLIASIYGMNFIHMPEISWKFGYPIALLLIFISALAPYFLLKRRGRV